jgi:hypothetical protein
MESMAISPARTALYFIGVFLMVAALYIFIFQTGLNRWIPGSLLAAGALLIIGLAIMSYAGSAPPEGIGPRHEHEHEDDGDVTVVNR